MNKKIMVWASGAVVAVAGVVLPMLASAQISTTTLGSSIDTVNGAWYDYFGVMITHYWPFAVGALLLVGVIRYGKSLANALFG